MRKRIVISIILFLIIVIYTSSIFAQSYESIKTSNLQFRFSIERLNNRRQLGKLSTSLKNLYDLFTKNKDFIEFANRDGLNLIDNKKVVVTILPQDESTTDEIDRQALEDFGVTIQATAKHSMRVEIPIGNLEKVSTNVKGSGEIRRLIKPKALSITSEGVSLMKADDWQNAGYQGDSVRVAVIDLGFKKLTSAQLNGDIPASYKSYDFSNTGLQTGTKHGTAVAEAIYDIAPKVKLFLYKISDLTDFENAVKAAKNDSVNIINHSVGWFNTGGYYDGTGYVCETASSAIMDGIIWVNAAGNEAQNHYRATFASDAYNRHDYGNGANVNPLGPDPQHVWYHDPGEEITICLNWNNYPTTNQDYDLILLRWTDSGWVYIRNSARRQNGTISPEETISYINPYINGMYGIVVEKHSATINADFTLFSLGRSLGFHKKSNSLTDPASLDGVISVGAINKNNYAAGPQESFSSQGPTADGRIKPDITAPDNCNSFTYGYWYGTSLASPHVAGVVALIKSRFSKYTSSQIKDYLFSNCAVDLGATGKDNIYGWGKLELPEISNSSETVVKIILENNQVRLNSNIVAKVMVDSVSNLGAFEFDLLYNGKIVKIDSSAQVVLGNFLGSTHRNASSIGPVINNENGQLKFGAFSFGSNQGPEGSGVLATITWTAYDTGRTTLKFKDIKLTDIDGSIIPIKSEETSLFINNRFWADINGDNKVDITDIQMVAGKWNSIIGDSLYDPICDVDNDGDGDGDIDIVDIQLVAWWWHKQIPGLNNFNVGKIASKTVNNVILRVVSLDEDNIKGLKILVDNVEKMGAFQFDLVSQNLLGRIEKVKLGEFFAQDSSKVILLDPQEKISENKITFGAFSYGNNSGASGSGVIAKIILSSVPDNLFIKNVKITDVAGNMIPVRVEENISATESHFNNMPKTYSLQQNYPNPFNPKTTIYYQLPKQSQVTLGIYNILGEKIITLVAKNQSAGYYSVHWDSKDERGNAISNGVYLYILKANEFAQVRKMVLLR